MKEQLFTQFQTVGRDLFRSRLISSHGGNLSVRVGDTIYITRSGCQLAHLTPDDIVAVPVVAPVTAGNGDVLPSSELVVHRALYAAREAESGATTGAVVHAHSLHTTARSFTHDIIVPCDFEAKLLIAQTPVVETRDAISAPLVPLVVVRGHGPFAQADTLEDAYQLVSVLEHSCELLDIIECSA